MTLGCNAWYARVAKHNVACWQVIEKLPEIHRARRRRFVMCTPCQTGDDVLVSYVLDVNGVAGHSVLPAEVSVSCTISPLYLCDEPIDDEYYLVVLELCRVVWVLK